jgi:hypothetical protein
MSTYLTVRAAVSRVRVTAIIRSSLRAAFIISLLFTSAHRASAKANWENINPADLAASESKSAPGADLEILFSRHRMDTSSSSTITEHHYQAKVYTPKGIERTTLFTVDHEKRRSVFNLKGRVVKPDGTFVELAKSDFHESTFVKSGGFELLRTTFSFPNVQAGDVLEYQWSEEIDDSNGYYIQYCQAAEIPTRLFEFEILGAKSDFNLSWFNCPTVERDPKLKKVSIRNIPPFIAEPLIPTETEFRGWLMIQFTSRELRMYSSEDAWREIGDYYGELFRLDTNPNPALRAKANLLIANATTSEGKLAALYDFSRTAVKNLDFYEGPELADAKKKRQGEDGFQTPAKTLDRGTGITGDINRLFGALARAAGFEVRLAWSPDRSRVLSMKGKNGWVFADRRTVAVKVGENWTFYSPGATLVPPGLLDLKDQGAFSFVCDEKKAWFETTQIALPEQTRVKRIGRFQLDDEGTLEGEVEEQLTGHRAILARDKGWNWSTDEHAKSIRESLARRLSTAEITDVRPENVASLLGAYRIRYHVRIPGYAEAIGSRLAVPLNYFEVNVPQVFTNETRRYPIFFDHAEEVRDDIEIIFPEGFALEGASAPAPVGKVDDVISAKYGVKFLPKTRTLGYQREYVIGRGGVINFQAESYPALRKLFDRIHRSDAHQLVIKPKSPAVAAAAITEASTQ